MAMDARSLVALGPRVPEMLGNFHLDDHNVEEWSDATNPGVRHKARKEIGKWIDPESNADIQYQKREDCKQSDRSQEQTRTEVIQGQAPDSTFQIVRSHSQFQDAGGDKSNSRVQTSSTSYQMSSSSGVRSTSKSTSNRTTTKTLTMSGGRTDDFENLKMSFQPLDTSTQRERINVSRSGTMGIRRRPPTRRHTPAAALSSSPEDNIDTRDEIIVDSDDNIRNSPDLPSTTTKLTDPGGLSIVGFKNISPKIRVGFPVEIYLELQTKLRSSSNMGKDNDEEILAVEKSSAVNPNGSGSTYHRPSTTIMQDARKEIEQMERIADDSATPLFELSANNEDSTFDFKQRRKSYGFESFDSHTKQAKRPSDHSVAATQYDIPSPEPDDNANHVTYHHPIITHHKIGHGLTEFSDNSSENMPNRSHFPGLSPSSISRSWDLIQSAVTAQQRREANKKLFHSTSTMNGTLPSYATTADSGNSPTESYPNVRPLQKTTVTLNTFDESRVKASLSNIQKTAYPMDSLESIPGSRISNSKQVTSVANLDETETQVGCTPDVLHHEASILSPSLERSRKLLKMLDETPDLLHKMSYKNYFSEGLKSEAKHWDERGEVDWGTQRQLSFLNDSLTRILENGRGKEAPSYDDRTGHDTDSSNWINNDHSRVVTEDSSSSRHENFVDETEIDINGNVKGRVGQVSQTWISSGEQKPSQKVRDKDVTTSISATNDPFKRGPKKVEFCKTEVHFTADSGKVHIVETDENKPSTSHLFRKKKKVDKGKQSSSSASTDQEELGKSETEISQTEVDEEEKMRGNSTELTQTDREYRELKSGVGVLEGLLFQHRSGNEVKPEQSEIVNRVVPPATAKIASNSSVMKNAPATSYTRREQINSNKSLPMLSLLREKLNDDSEEVFGRSHVLMNMNDVGGDEVIQSPSHMILSNYGEMKIQRYLKQLKSPSSNNGSESPTELLDTVPDDDHPSHFRFDNVLYEHGSFVPLATRRSLIEMNNRNRKRNTTSHISDNSSTTSNYSLPNSEKDNSASAYQPLRLARMEAKVATARAKPQITSVELRYELDNNERPSNPELIRSRQHHLNLRPKVEKRACIPTVMSELNDSPMHRNEIMSFSISPEQPQSIDSIQEIQRNVKPPTPILPSESYTTHDKGSAIRDRYYYQNPSYEYNAKESEDNLSRTQKNDFSMSASSVISTAHNKGSSKSIVTIGDYGTCRSVENRRILSPEDYSEKSETTPEPILSMDHTWKGPAHFDIESSSTKGTPVIRSLTFPKSSRSEPEWVSKARSRETRVTDWDLIGKQVESDAAKADIEVKPPWMDEIMRHRSKSTTLEEVKTLPKISIVYPWQRHRDSDNSKPVEEDNDPEIEEIEERSHIVSIVPAPPMLSTRKESSRRVSHHAKSTTILESPKLLEPGIPVNQQSKRDIVDRDSDSIVINPAQILKKAELAETKSKGKLRFEGQVQSLEDSRSYITTIKSTGPSVRGVDDAAKLITGKSRQSSKASPNSTSTTKTQKNPKPPQRISSLVKAETESNQLSAKSSKSSATQTMQKDKGLRRGIIKKSDMEESSGSSRSNTPIHRHPTVQVSKLPIRKNLPSKPADAKPVSTAFGTKIKNKDKHHVAENSESKQSGKTQTKAAGSSPTSDSTNLKSQKPSERRHATQKLTSPIGLSSNRKK